MMKEVDFEFLRKYVACFGTLSCRAETECPFEPLCATECLTRGLKKRKAKTK